MSDLILPKYFDDRNGTYPQHKGKIKLSYSQYNSYNDPEYKLEYYLQYFMGIKLPSGEFADFGSAVGEYIESRGQGEIKQGILSQEDVEILENIVTYPDNCVYEDEVVLDLGDFVLEGYIDRSEYKLANVVDITDFKTLNIDKKSAYYASNDYKQTTIYCYFKEQQGFVIGNSQVVGLGRKGNSLNGTGNFKMRLSGESKLIPTPYSKERAEEAIKDIRETAKKISDDYKIYLKLFGE